jgi:miniconductance mechanosensitive channel
MKDMTRKDIKDSDSPFYNYSQITNLGVFRFYAESYVKKYQDVDKSQTILIKHKQIEGNGLPLQIYLFTKNNQFVPYENLQSEIVEHFLAILSEFGLKVFQQPTGDDLQPILNKGNN